MTRLRGASLFVRVLWRSNAVLRRHQSCRRLHAVSQQHVGQLQVRSYNDFCICVYAYIYASGVHMSCDPLATRSPFRGSTPSQDQPEKLSQDFHLAIYNTFIYPNAFGYIYLSSSVILAGISCVSCRHAAPVTSSIKSLSFGGDSRLTHRPSSMAIVIDLSALTTD